MREIIVNLKKTILTYAAEKNHRHREYVEQTEFDEHVDTIANNDTNGHVQVKNNLTYNGNSPVTSKGIYDWVMSKINGLEQTYIKKTDIIDNLTSDSSTQALSAKQGKTLKGLIDNVATQLSKVTTDWSGHSITNPKETTTQIDHLVTRGYYIYKGTKGTFSCSPDTISYKNALITVEKQSNHIIQHVYATSYSNAAQTYKIDGRIFVRHGYTTAGTNGQAEYHWEKWYVEHIPWRERNDLLKTRGPNVNAGSFTIHECTAGYVFTWKQGGTNDRYDVPMAKYSYSNVYTFETLPIAGTYIIGDLIGRLDVRITNSSLKVRTLEPKGSYIVGVDMTYFAPRTN